ncbi:MAG: integration host factor, actinobacterial type, partial [Ilumatobacteraceae bacterium]
VASAERIAIIKRARAIRQHMTDVLTQLASGSLVLADALNNSNSEAAVNRLYVVKVLESLPGIGKVVARRVMSDIGIAEKCRVGQLESAHRASLIKRFAA